MLNLAGTVHGGVLATLIDSAADVRARHAFAQRHGVHDDRFAGALF
jgi:acyl-coenzyme A thioesterase PaaI-like protein